MIRATAQGEARQAGEHLGGRKFKPEAKTKVLKANAAQVLGPD